MTQRHISHPEGLPACATGHSARHIHDLRGPTAGGGHLVECACRATSKSQDPERALAEWRRINRPPRAARAPSAPAPAAGNVYQLGLALTGRPGRARAAGGAHGSR